MDDRVLLRWAGYCAFAWVIAFAGMLAMVMAKGGLDWAAWIPMFSLIICLYVVILLAGYDYIAKVHYALARIGFVFGLLLIVVLFAEVAAWGADRMILREDSSATGSSLSPMLALFNSTHTLAIWFHGLWLGIWGVAFARLRGKGRVIGWLLLLFAVFYSVYYLLLRLGHAALAEMAHSAGHVALLVSHWLLGMLFLEASREASTLIPGATNEDAV